MTLAKENEEEMLFVVQNPKGVTPLSSLFSYVIVLTN